MIRVRDKNGKATVLPPSAGYVEICAEDGTIAAILVSVTKTHTTVLEPKDIAFKIYIDKYKKHGARAAKVIPIDVQNA